MVTGYLRSDKWLCFPDEITPTEPPPQVCGLVPLLARSLGGPSSGAGDWPGDSGCQLHSWRGAGAHLHDDQMISLPSSQSRGEGGIQGFGRKAVNENVWVHEWIMDNSQR